MAEALPKAKSGRGKYIGAGIAVAVVGAIVIFMMSDTSTSSNNSSNNPLNTITRTEHSFNIVNGIIGVPAGGYQYYGFSAPSGASDVRVEGSYTASGGSGNDIRIYILDQTAFTNWQNDHSVETYYNSGQLTTGNINARVPTGETLYLVYDNTFSAFTDKDVTTKADVLYTN